MIRCAVWALAAVLTTVVAIGCGGSPHRAAPPVVAQHRLLLGIQDDALLTSGEPKAWPDIVGLRPRVIRYNLSWRQAAPTRPAAATDPADPAYHFETADGLLRNAVAVGAQPLVTLDQSPTWASGESEPSAAPALAATFGDWCAAVARRYSGTFVPAGETKPLPEVDRFTIWNEVNRGQFFQPQGPDGGVGPVRYASVYAACAPRIHAINPHAIVALGPLASRGGQGGLDPLAWLAAYQAAGGEAPDALAFNPYMNGLLPVYLPREHTSDRAITLRNLDQLEQATRTAFGRATPIWLTEFAWRTAATPRLGVLTARQQADLMRRTVTLVRVHEPYVQLLVWFLLRDESPTSYWRSGLVEYDWTKKPAYDLWASLTRESAG